MESPFRYHGVQEIHHNGDDLDALAEEIRNLGYTVLASGFSALELQQIREASDAVYARQVLECGGEENLVRMKDASIARCALSYDDCFVRLAAHPGLMRLVAKLLGENFILMGQNAIINRVDRQHDQVVWHRDLTYQHFVSSRPLAISALWCIDDFTELTGATTVLPVSHKVEAFPSCEFVLKHQRIVEAKAGSIIVFDAMLYHRGGDNRSGRTRLGVNHIFGLPLLKQQIDLPSALGGKFRDDPVLARLLGYESASPPSAFLWRKAKIDRANGRRSAATGRALPEGEAKAS
jgi:ectoine hydroxylase-related dioxygenase (phytanoyl-CoA dioxygenase family)